MGYLLSLENYQMSSSLTAGRTSIKNFPRPEISVIVPAFNEEGSIAALLRKLKRVLKKRNAKFEIIVIDDRSTDGTMGALTPFLDGENIFCFTKKGGQGKAYSILEGIARARFAVVAIIDADLQYPPEAIPSMLDKIRQGYDVVVANRNEKSYGLVRRMVSRSFSRIFGRMLYGIDCDVQSGLKVFRKEVFEVASLHPTPWTFDLEFLVQAKAAGFSLGTVEIDFAPRTSGESKVDLVRASMEIGTAALRLKLREPVTAALPKQVRRREGDGFFYRGKKFIPHTRLLPQVTALTSASIMQKLIIAVLAAVTAAALVVNWHQTVIVLVAAITFMYLADFLFNLFLIYRSFRHSPVLKADAQLIRTMREADWPSYTIFCPLYREWEVLPQFIRAMSSLEYPPEKLQIILLLEEDDAKTIEKVRQHHLPANFEVVVVPHSAPKTKPKALNYGLRFARGKYTVVYDAEDIPDPAQLKKAVAAFYRTDAKTVCIQAKLNFFNPYQNILTRIFTAEYSLWFDLILTGLQSIDAPIPLGGTSNHFPTSFLRRHQGWDAFNVTEDCDLGIRLFKSGYRTKILDSTTYEEANSDIGNWVNQRSRWIKGYIQTYFVHMRSLKSFRVKSRTHHFISFQFIVGGKILSMFINPFMWATTVIYFAFRPLVGPFIDSFFPGPVLYMGVFSLVFGNFLYLYYYMIGCIRRKQYALVKYAYLVPLYWLGMSAAAWVAVYSLIFKPHYWAKTVHGLHLRKGTAPAGEKRQLPNWQYAYNQNS